MNHTKPHVKNIAANELQVNPKAQRPLNQRRVKALAADFNEMFLGDILVSHRNGKNYIMDGQHRVAASIQVNGPNKKLRCRVWDGLTSRQEATMFIGFNDMQHPSALSTFLVNVHGKHPVETAINTAVKKCGLQVSGSKENSIRSVSALYFLHNLGGAGLITRTLTIINSAYGHDGMSSYLIQGVGLVCHRYGNLDDEYLIAQLRRNGVANALLSSADTTFKKSSLPRRHSVAAEVVTAHNRGRRGPKLTSWWKAMK